jgi:AraC-like DNA-binding protein
MSYQLTVLPDMMGQITNSSGDFPVYVRDGVSDGADDITRSYTSQYHWHPDLEFIYYREGANEFFINGSTVRVEAGQAVFINSRRLHCSNSHPANPRSFICVRIRPNIFTTEAKAGAEYFERKFSAGGPDYMILDSQNEGHKAIIDGIVAVAEKMRNVETMPLSVLSAALELTEKMGEMIPDAAFADNTNRDHGIYIDMVEYIRDNYAQKIKTDDIAAAGRVSRAKVFQLFDQYAHISPNTYVINYRITKSCELLRDSGMSIMEISEKCGFQTSSYFSRVFCKEKGITPREYRASARNRV